MVNMTLSIPEDIYKEMMMHSELKWSDIARQAFEKKKGTSLDGSSTQK